MLPFEAESYVVNTSASPKHSSISRSSWTSSDPKMRTRSSYIPYTHYPINRNRSEIRLLTLHPGDFDPPIRCSVSHFSLDEKDWKTDEFKYIALPYRWSEGDREILIDGRQFKIGDNLFNALLQLRQIPRTTVWADAICINQNDEDEKSWQVQRMSKIYITSNATVVWLGLDEGYGRWLLWRWLISRIHTKPRTSTRP